MRGERADDDLDSQLPHESVGRGELLDELDRLLLHDSADRCVVLTGEAGVGKTAIVTSWLARRGAVHDLVFHHVIRRRGDRAEPWRIVRSLAAQIEHRFPHLRDPFARPEARLGGLLARVSARELAPHGLRMVLVIDGLDERATGSELRDLLACWPRTQPDRIQLLLAGRLRDPRRDLDGRCRQVVAVDLDEPHFALDNEAAVRAFWAREAPSLGLDDGFAERAVGAAAGNMLHAALLRTHLAGVPPSQHRPDAIPRGLPSLLAALWQRVAGDRAAVRILEILCAAREPLTLDQIGRVAGWTDSGDLRAALHVARELIVETGRDDRCGDRTGAYGPSHDAVRSFLTERLGPIAVRGHHRELADKLATWPLPRDPATRRYALRHAVGHCIAAGDCRAIQALAGDTAFLEARCGELGIDEVELDVRRAAEACLAAGHMTLHGELDRLARSIARESSSVSRDPGTDTAPLWTRIRHDGRPAEPAKPPSPPPPTTGATSIPRRGPSLRGHPSLLSAVIGHAATVMQEGAAAKPAAGATAAAAHTTSLRARPALLGALTGRGAVTACAVTPDSRRIVAAYTDHSLKLWDLDSGRLVKTLTGHTAAVESCAISPDGRRIVSASADTTLKLWDLRSGDLLATLHGHTASVESCAVSPDGRWIVSASADTTLKIWDLETGNLLATFEGHTASVESCAVSPDGRWVVSASADTTLKIWDLRTGEQLATFQGHTHAVASCAITPDGRRIVSGSGDHTLRVWDVGTGSATTTLRGHTGPVASAVVAPDNRSVYSASSDTTLKIWDVDTGRMVTTLDGHTRPITCCAVTPDGRRLISGSSDTTLKIWALDGSRTSTLPGGTRAMPAAASSTVAGDPLVHHARKPGARQLILFLAAASNDASRQVLDDECAAIDRELQMARHGSDFELRSEWAFTVDEMARHLLDLDPTIIHFRGQARPDAQHDSAIYLHDERRGVQRVTGRALKMMIRSSAPSARLVVLDACYGDDHAAELCQVVDCVVGMARDHDHASLSFAAAFYRALGHRRSVGDAVAHAVAMLAVNQVPDECIPRCRTPNWVDPHDISLVPEAPISPDR